MNKIFFSLYLILACVIIIIQFRYSSGTLCLVDHASSSLTCQSCPTNVSKASDVPTNLSHQVLRFCSFNFFLDEVIKIGWSKCVRIEGSPTEIHCTAVTSSGIHVSHVTNVTIVNITLKNCGTVFEAPFEKNPPVYFASSIFIDNSSHITVDSVKISRSRGSGLTMLNNGGVIQIKNCNFEHNSPGQVANKKLLPGGVGLHIETLYCGHKLKSHSFKVCSTKFRGIVRDSDYTIIDSKFINNTGGYSGKKSHLNIRSSSAWGRGGGMSVVVNNYSYGGKFSIIRCNISHNTALWGGGLYIVINNNSSNINFNIKNTNFSKNMCPSNAGGGVDAGYRFSSYDEPNNNFINFSNCNFFENEAFYGGGVSFYSSKSMEKSNSLSFKDCVWTRNKAVFGAALEISPQNGDSNVFDLRVFLLITDSNFTSNSLLDSPNDAKLNSGKGTVWIQGFSATFSGYISFINNSGSALYVISSKLEFLRNSNVAFLNNSGFQGGAMAIIGFSAVIFSDNSTFEFISNIAQDGGGAIFHLMYSKRNIYTSSTCFLQNSGRNYNTTQFVFVNNSGTTKGRENMDMSHFGHSIYSTTLQPCYSYLDKDVEISYENMFSALGNFTFVDRNRHDLSTSENIIKLTNTSTVYTIPGEHFMLTLVTLDELNNQIATVFHVTVINIGTSTISVDSDYTYMSNNRTVFYGKPGDSAHVVLKTITIREAVYEFTLHMLECPPGYIHQNNSGRGICTCSAKLKLFEGIPLCDSSAFQSKLSGGYWAGYKKGRISVGNYSKESDLMLSYCPHSQCFENSLDEIEHLLPRTSSKEELDFLICGHGRTGILCSRCREGYSVHYHSNHNRCLQSRIKCNFGWLFYILSELVPVTVLFIVVTVLGIKLTSGSVSGFILFMQISDKMRVQSNGFIVFPKFAKEALNIYFTIANMFNLGFFQNDKTSFCLWESATNLDIMAIKYVTILYALILILVIVIIIKYCNSKVLQRLNSISHNDFTTSIIHGISGFLVICYSECTRISLFLLTPVTLFSMNAESGLYVRSLVPFHDGELMYFKGSHLVYALPALFVLLMVGIMSPVVLLAYPLCYKVFALFKISESKWSKFICTVVPLEKGKPFFDSFQSSFKDDYRFFSGLYFVYRLVTLVAFTFISEPMLFYITLEGFFVLIAIVQAIFQPHRERKHSILDAMLFMNLCIINLITMLNQNLSYSFTDRRKYVNIFSTIQVVLLYIPLVYICIYFGQRVTQNIRCKKPVESENNYYRKFSSVSISLMNAAEYRANNKEDI